MSTIHSRPALAAPHGRGRAVSLVGWLIRRDAQYREARLIEELSDHILRDIGLTREELRRGRRAD